MDHVHALGSNTVVQKIMVTRHSKDTSHRYCNLSGRICPPASSFGLLQMTWHEQLRFTENESKSLLETPPAARSLCQINPIESDSSCDSCQQRFLISPICILPIFHLSLVLLRNFATTAPIKVALPNYVHPDLSTSHASPRSARREQNLSICDRNSALVDVSPNDGWSEN